MDDSPPASTLPGLLDALCRLEERLARIERRLDRLDALDELPNLVALATDTLDQHAAQLQARGVDLQERAQTALMLLERITEPNAAKAVTSMLELAELAPSTIAHALSRAQQAAPHALGMFGLLRALSDRDVQHALGFAVAFAREFGRSITPTDVQRALPAATHTP